MRLSRWLSVLILPVLAACTAVGAEPASVAVAAPALHAGDQPYRRGVNVLGYDPYWKDVGKRRFQWRHFREIRSAGFDFVRVNLQAFQFMDAQNRSRPGSPEGRVGRDYRRA